MTEGVGKNDLAAFVLGKVNCGVVALAVFTDAGNDNYLAVGKSESFGS